MSTSTMNCTVVGICGVSNFDEVYDTPAYDKSYAFVGYSTTAFKYNTAFLKFTTPEFLGRSAKLDFKFKTGVMNYYRETVELRYALCTSDANHTKYTGTHDEVEDENQIATGTVVFETVGANNDGPDGSGRGYLSIETKELKKNTTYYLIFWAASTALADTGLSPMTITVGYDSGLVYIDNGTEPEAYQPYIDNGSGWDQVMPYVDNGESWDMCN
jgi:hypothetical protein